MQIYRSLGGGRREEDGGDGGFEIVVLLLPHKLSETTEMMDGDAADDVMEMDSHGTLRGASWPTAPAEDLQIAWENLDLARSIVSRLVEEDDDDDNSPLTPKRRTDLLLDLAQIHARLGDLQRANANVLPCIDDYVAALDLRKELLGPFDRRTADSHFSLAGACAEAPSQTGEDEGRVDNFVRKLGGDVHGDAKDTGRANMSEAEKADFRRRSLEHYLACGVAFAGLMAGMCGEDAGELTDVHREGGKGEPTDVDRGHSESMAILRERIAILRPPVAKTAREEFDDLKETMDEIQEAMDTARETEEGLRSLGEMKVDKMRKHDPKSEDGGAGTGTSTSGGGATTTIGFGAGDAFAADAFGGGAATAGSAATAAPAMMVVKKKKKPQAEDSAKRIKPS